MAAVIVCGGMSRRMGTDKALLEIDGRRLLDRVAERVATVAEPVIVASGRPGRLGRLPWAEVPDVAPGAGPASGVVAGLRAAAAAGATAAAAVGVDLPDIDPDVLRHLRDHVGAGADVAVPRGPVHDHWLHAVWATAAADHLEAGLRAGLRSFGDLAGGLRVAVVHHDDDRFAVNLNTPADVRRYELRQQ